MDPPNLDLPEGFLPEPISDNNRDLPTFSHEPLKSERHIRLLCTRYHKLENPESSPSADRPTPGSPHEFLSQYEFIQVNLRHPPQYHAISYAWGDPERTHSIKVSETSHFQITKSLAVALPYLVRQCDTGLLWIDQICIDQANLEERSHQVQQMGEIYKGAEEVMIWLGEETSGTRRMTSHIRVPRYLTDGDYLEMVELFRRPWFGRAWVVQEAVLAKEATCIVGTCVIPLADLWRAAKCYWDDGLWKEYHASYYFLSGIRSLREEEREPGSIALDFDVLLGRVGDCQTSDPRDHIYAFLGLKGGARLGIVPDYALPTSQVFTSVTRAMIERKQNLDIFRLLPNSRKAIEGLPLPSWVPDWSKTKSGARILPDPCSLSRPGQELFNAARGLRHRVFDSFQPTEHELLVFGKIIDIVEIRLPPLSRSLHASAFMKTGEQRPFFSLFAEQIAFLDETSPGDPEQRLGKRIVTVLSADNCKAEDILSDYETGVDAADYFLRVRREELSDYEIMRTRQEKLMLAPQDCLQGDSIVVLHGLKVPVVIRRLAEGTYIVVGQCYLEDAMHGEAVTWEEDAADMFTLV